MEEAKHLRHTSYNKEVYPIKSQTIERVFADIKEKHGIHYTSLKGVKKIKCRLCLFLLTLILKN